MFAELPDGLPPLAMWVWDSRAVTVPAQRDRLMAFCRAQRITTLYVSAYNIVPQQAESYRAFNREALRQAIGIHALAGDPRWALPRYQRLSLAWVESVLAFNAAAHADERFDGIHTDIEPYLLSRMWAEHPAQLLGGLLELHARAADLLNAQRPMELGADVPFWYDDDETYRIQWRGQVLPPSHHLLRVADYVTVLAYRNHAAGSDGAIELSRREIEYAEPIGKGVVVGQETQQDLFPSYITYGGTSLEYFWAEVAKIVRAFRSRTAFRGVAIHHYESYQELAE